MEPDEQYALGFDDGLYAAIDVLEEEGDLTMALDLLYSMVEPRA